jgi:hypothetical protein
MKEQTAVELVKQLFFTYAESAWYNDEDSWTISNTDFEQIINQSLQVERDRIIESKLNYMTAEEIMKKNIPNGIVNIKGKGDGKPQYRAEVDVIVKCMVEYAEQQVKNCSIPDVLNSRLSELEEENRKLKFIIENGLGVKDLENDCL